MILTLVGSGASGLGWLVAIAFQWCATRRGILVKATLTHRDPGHRSLVYVSNLSRERLYGADHLATATFVQMFYPLEKNS